jgi:hypothetical protein
MRWMPRLRLLLARRPWIYWLGVALLAAVVTLGVASSSAELDRQRAAWGRTTTVYTATRAINVGDALAGAVTAVDLPVAMIPETAVRDLPGSAVAVQRLAPGEVVVEVDIAHGDGPGSLLPAGWLAVAIDAADNAMFGLGDPVSVLAAGSVIAPDGLVVDLGDTGLVVGVPADVAAAVADAAIQRTAVVALSASS